MNADDQNYAETQLPAYAIGALDAEDRQLVEELIAGSPTLQEELRQLREVVALLPYTAPPIAPPERIRERLFARIETDRAASAAPAPARRRAARWLMPGLVAFLAAFVLLLGGLTLGLGSSVARLEQSNGELVAVMSGLQQSLETTMARQETLADQLAASERQLGEVSAQLAASERQLGEVSARLDRDEHVISFVSAPGVATRELTSANGAISARGEMYMYPGEASAVVLFSGLPALESNQVYQFWLADDEIQIAGGTFQVDRSGLARIVVEAPREVNAYSEVMVTVEPVGGSQMPSEQVVLAGSL